MPLPAQVDEDTEFIFDSRTLSEEEIERDNALDEGREYKYTAKTKTYQAPEPEAPAPTAAEPEPLAAPSSVPPEPSGENAGEGAGSETAAAPEPAELQETEEEKKKKGGWQRKIHKLDAENGTLKSQLAERDRKLAELEARLAGKPAEKPEVKAEPTPPSAPAPAVKPAEEDPEPQEEEFPSYGEYAKAAARWAVRDERRQEQTRETERKQKDEAERTTREAEEAKRMLEADQAALTERWNLQLAAAREAHPDLDEVFGKKHPEPIANGVMWNTMMDDDDGAELGYWLATHPAESTRIEELTRLTEKSPQSRVRQAYARAAVEFDKIRAKIEVEREDEPEPSPPAPEAKPAAPVAPPQAAPAPAAKPIVPKKKPLPEPITPIGTRGGGGYQTLRQLMSTKEGIEKIRVMPDSEYERRTLAGEGSEE